MTVEEMYTEIGGDYKDMCNRLPKESMIEKFVRKYADSCNLDEMEEAYKEKDYKKVFDISHNIKGMAANLSMTRQYNIVAEICEACRHGEPQKDLSELFEQAKKEQELLVSLIKKL